jgi:molybdopterin-containing oxidoreductase family membrane subunit
MSTTARNVMSYASLTRDTLKTLDAPKRTYWLVLLGLMVLVAMLFGAWGYQIHTGLGVTGLGNPVGWGTYITTMVFWIGIAHAGTLISAILLLLRARFRTSIYRISEATTVFGLATAGLFPLLHMGRIWVGYTILPYPSGRELWPNFRSPLTWDVLAISTYLTISLIFFYVGLIPDLATLRDKADGLRKKIFTGLALGWQGSDTQWKHYTAGYVFFAALATPLVISVHSVVSWDFAMAVIPGWHTTIFAPYFVAGAILSGLAMVMTIIIPMRKLLGLEHIITSWHLGSMAKMVIMVSLIVGYAYGVEYFIAWYSGNPYEEFIFSFRPTGNYAFGYWIMVVCNALVPLLFFFRKFRDDLRLMFVVAILINVGMWFERFNIIVTSLARDFMPFAWGDYSMSWVEAIILLGSFGLFFLLVLLFVKHLPAIATSELKESLDPPVRSPEQKEVSA